MQWLWFFGVAILLIITSIQYNIIDSLRSDAEYTSSYVSSLEDQAQVLLKNMVVQEQKVRSLTFNLSVAEAERNFCVLQNNDATPLAPQKRVDISSLSISEDAATINVKDLVPGIIAPTGSMFPLLQGDTIVLEEVPESYHELVPGDIIIFEYKESRIIHRIISIGWDENGWYAITKGDNNPVEDPFKIRFKDVRGVVVGILY